MKTTFKSINLALCALIALSACKKSDDTPQETPVNSYTNVELGSQQNPNGCFLSYAPARYMTSLMPSTTKPVLIC